MKVIFKKHQLMLIGNDKKPSNLNLFQDRLLVGTFGPMKNNVHLYVVSDERIGMGDWYLIDQYCNGKLLVSTQPCSVLEVSLQDKFKCHKIVASTDSTLRVNNLDDVDRLIDVETVCLKIPEKFVTEFVSGYNIGLRNFEVIVEYVTNKYPELHGVDCDPRIEMPNKTIKIRSNIESYTTEEVINLLYQLEVDIKTQYSLYDRCGIESWMDKYLEK